MTDHLDPEEAELLELAPVVGLNALSSDELRDIEARVASAPGDFRELFAKQVRATREAMAAISAATATPPPPSLRDRVLAAARAEAGLEEPSARVPGPSVEIVEKPGVEAPESAPPPVPVEPPADLDARRPDRSRRFTYLTAAAVAAIAVGALGWAIGLSNSDEPATTPPVASPAEQVFSAGDLRSTSAPVATGSATIYLAQSADTAVLVMNSVPPPKPGTVYQMWLVGPGGTRSAGTMTDADVEPVTTAVLSGINTADALAFTVEPPGGSTQPTSAPVAQLSLS
ncbi:MULTISPECIES: anti-sigma factor [Gordonia]|uniref:Regulator of SigK n=1 Tax=Gordonia amicalis TaxID=89053 RepID=A0AAE4R9L5_9ACTN|nr:MULTISPECIES: anti-sigma factor [Gordonia]ATD68997.1 anti-sigma factor [Gordonia sp. 1D]MCZ0910931.1 anti-sigma factor [Gordonia amicalis]MCZ4581062.1 anti-sigma factor [Gordonia amicalis]MCZ4653527.1 anti-sigma factor [Gordonia amicalis]MDJ0454844.1 anti-sigma factor [Gordonia amicalis]